MFNDTDSEPFLTSIRRFTISHNRSELFTTIGIVGAIVVLSVVAGLSVRTSFFRTELFALAIHTSRIMQQLEKLSTDLSDAESEALGFRLTKTSRYLDRYKARIRLVEEDLEQLRVLTEDGDAQTPHRHKVEASVGTARKTIELLMANVETSMPQQREAMDAFRTTVHLMQEDEESQLDVRLAALEQTGQEKVRLMAVGILLTAALLGWLLWMIRVETVRRRLAQEKLERSHAQLENRVHERTSQLMAANERLSSVSKQIIQVQEEERRSIARDLHDEIGQALTAVKMNAQEIEERAKGTEIEPLVHDSLDLLGQLLSRVRGLALELRPSLLDELGLREASKWYLNKFAKRSGLTITFEADPSWDRLAEEIEIACFRVLQEALTNVVKHAHATRVTVSLHRTCDYLELTVCDNGTGFTLTEARRRVPKGAGLGLLGMEERLHLFGGVLRVDSTKGAGTEVRARFPLRTIEVETARVEVGA